MMVDQNSVAINSYPMAIFRCRHWKDLTTE